MSRNRSYLDYDREHKLEVASRMAEDKQARKQVWLTSDGLRWHFEGYYGDHWLMRRAGIFSSLRDPVFIAPSDLRRDS